MKPEIVFGLEGAAWPALLVNAGGSILRANSAAMTVFGPVLSGETPPLSAIWSPDNGGTDGQFLMLWEQAPTPTADLNFRAARGTAKFTVAICTFNKDGSKWYVLQLLPFVEPVAPPVPVPAVLVASGNFQAGGSGGRGRLGAQAKTGLCAPARADGLD